MAHWEHQRIREAILEHRYALTEHAYHEMADDSLDVLDVELAILTGEVERTLTHDPRGRRYVVVGTATDLETAVGVVLRFAGNDEVLIITVYEIK